MKAVIAFAAVSLCWMINAPARAQERQGAIDLAWLAYRPVDAGHVFPGGVPDTIVVLGHDPLERSAARELSLGWRGMLEREPRVKIGRDDAPRREVVIGTSNEIRNWKPAAAEKRPLGADAFRLLNTTTSLVVEGGNARGVLYGVFALLRFIAEEHSTTDLDKTGSPAEAVRWTNEWDNANGSIERGYAGPSIFFEAGRVKADLSLAAAYARLLGSVGINGCTINNVNADISLLTAEHLREIARIADVFASHWRSI